MALPRLFSELRQEVQEDIWKSVTTSIDQVLRQGIEDARDESIQDIEIHYALTDLMGNLQLVERYANDRDDWRSLICKMYLSPSVALGQLRDYSDDEILMGRIRHFIVEDARNLLLKEALEPAAPPASAAPSERDELLVAQLLGEVRDLKARLSEVVADNSRLRAQLASPANQSNENAASTQAELERRIAELGEKDARRVSRITDLYAENIHLRDGIAALEERLASQERPRASTNQEQQGWREVPRPQQPARASYNYQEPQRPIAPQRVPVEPAAERSPGFLDRLLRRKPKQQPALPAEKVPVPDTRPVLARHPELIEEYKRLANKIAPTILQWGEDRGGPLNEQTSDRNFVNVFMQHLSDERSRRGIDRTEFDALRDRFEKLGQTVESIDTSVSGKKHRR